MVLKVAFKKHVSICSCYKKSSVLSSWCTVLIFWVLKYSGDFLFRARFYRWYFLQIMLLHNAMCLLSTVLIFWVSKIVGPFLNYLYKRPSATETQWNHIFCLKKFLNPLYGMELVWNGPWLSYILHLSMISNFQCVQVPRKWTILNYTTSSSFLTTPGFTMKLLYNRNFPNISNDFLVIYWLWSANV